MLSQDNDSNDHGPDIYNPPIATLLLRDSHFLTNATEGKPRVVGYTISCDDTDTDASITQCPLPNGKCLDAKRSENKYGVLCGLSCRLGSYGIAPDQCTSCEKGKYGDRTGTRASVCTLCPIGTYNPVEGAAGPGSCLPCEKGKYATMGAPQCLQVCRRGQEQLSNTECKDCPAGMTSDESPEPKCIECDFGKFAPTPGSRSCEKCPAGESSIHDKRFMRRMPAQHVLSRRLWACIPCKASEFSEPGSSMCAPCIPGQVVSAAGDSCERCPAGKQREYHQSACQPCAAGSAASIAGTASCTICPAGKRSNTDRTACTECNPNTFSTGAKDTCASCDADEASPPGSSRCYSCKPGFEFGDDGYTCKACLPGWERPHTPNDMLAMLPGTRSPLFKHGLLLTLHRGNIRCKCDIVRTLPRRLLLPGGAPLPTKCKDVSSYCPAGFLRAENRQSRHVHKPQAHSDDRVRRRLLLLERTSTQVPIGILLPCWSIKPHRHPRGHVHKRKSNKRVSVRGKLLLR